MKRWLSLFLIVVMLFSLTGCSFIKGIIGKTVTEDPSQEDPEPGEHGNDDPEPGEPGDDDPEPEEPGDDDPEPGGGVDGDFFSFDGDNPGIDVVLGFKELSFTMATVDEDEESSWSYSHKYVGSESIDGVQTKKFELTVNYDDEVTVTELWFSAAGELIKGGADGEYATGDEAAFYAIPLMFTFPIYAYSDEYADAFSSGDFLGQGWTLTRHEKGSKSFGGSKAKTDTYWCTGEEDGIKANYVWEISNFNGKLLVTGVNLQAEDGTTVEMVVEKAILF